MKKLICIVLIVALFCVMLAGCGQKMVEDLLEQSEAQISEELANTEESTISEEPAAQEEAGDTGNTPSTGDLLLYESFANYSEAKGLLTTNMMDLIFAEDNTADWAMWGSMEFLGISMSDLILIPLSICGMEGGEAALEIMGITGVEISQSGNNYKIAYKDTEGIAQLIEAKYDPASESLIANVSVDGEFFMLSEYTKTSNGYAGQIYSKSDDGTFSTIKVMINNAEATDGTIGFYGSQSSAPASIYQKGDGVGADFAQDADNWYSISGGKYTAMVDGQQYNS